MTVILYLLGGAAAGAVFFGMLYSLGFMIELANCVYQTVSCNWDYSDVFSDSWYKDSDFLISALLFCVICGACIGLVAGICITIRNAKENEQKKKFEEVYTYLSEEVNRISNNTVVSLPRCPDSVRERLKKWELFYSKVGDRCYLVINTDRCGTKALYRAKGSSRTFTLITKETPPSDEVMYAYASIRLRNGIDSEINSFNDFARMLPEKCIRKSYYCVF